MTTTKTRVYQKTLQNLDIPENLARNAAVVLRGDDYGVPRTDRGKRVINKLHKSGISESLVRNAANEVI